MVPNGTPDRWLDWGSVSCRPGSFVDFPVIGDLQFDEVQPGDVLAIIKARADNAVTEAAQAVQRLCAAQRQTERPGMTMDLGRTVQRVSPAPSGGLDMSRLRRR